MAIETLGDIVSEIADMLGIYGSCLGIEEGYGDCRHIKCRCCFESGLMQRMRDAAEVERKLQHAPAPGGA